MRRGQLNLFVPWLIWGTVCAVAMFMMPGKETIPYHMGYAGLAIAFGLDVWSSQRAYVSLAVYSLTTGGILALRASQDYIDWGEVTEFPLMHLLMALMVWHVAHRDAALKLAHNMAENDRQQVARRERLVRMTSHEMRTPLTIAAGYVDVLRETETGPIRNDLDVIREEIDRLDRACDRLLRMIRFNDNLPQEPVDVDRLLDDVVDRWRVVESRDWQVDHDAGTIEANAERILVCLDTLVENAVRYTGEGDVIRVFALQDGDTVRLGVADGGCGFRPDQIRMFNAPHEPLADATSNPDPRSRTGLGLSLVREIVESRGGHLEAGVAPEGGASVTLVLPGQRLAASRRPAASQRPAPKADIPTQTSRSGPEPAVSRP